MKAPKCVVVNCTVENDWGAGFSMFRQNDFAEIFMVDRKIIEDNDIVERISISGPGPPPPPILCLNLGFLTFPKKLWLNFFLFSHMLNSLPRLRYMQSLIQKKPFLRG